VLLKLAALDST